jgi:hypothetical protein
MDTATETHPVIAQAKETTDRCKERLLKTFSFVPDDKLTWTPAGSCRSALAIVAHVAITNSFMCGMIRRTPMPDNVAFEDMRAEAKNAEAALDTREKAVQALEESCARVQEAIDGVSPETLEDMVPSPFFTAPLSFWMFLPARHMDNHAAQIDLLQTCWGDMDWHM